MITINKVPTFRSLLMGVFIFLMTMSVYLIGANHAFALDGNNADPEGNANAGTTGSGTGDTGSNFSVADIEADVAAVANMLASCPNQSPGIQGMNQGNGDPGVAPLNCCEPGREGQCGPQYCPPPPPVVIPPTAIPVITTNPVTTITYSSAISGGTIVSGGGSSVLVSGLVWSTSTNPTTAGSKTTNGGTLTIPWSSTMTGLNSGTRYSVRAYATNGVGTGYGNERSFVMPVAVAPPADPTLTICPSAQNPYREFPKGSIQQFNAWFTDGTTTFSGCSSPNGSNVTIDSSTRWSRTGASTVASVSNSSSSKGRVTMGSDVTNTATIHACYYDDYVDDNICADGVTVKATCTPDSCSSPAQQTKAAATCTSDTFTFNDSCGTPQTCNGTRSCNFNWTEVAP